MTSPVTLDDIPGARAAILDRLAAAAKASGRPADAVTLVAISKKQPDARIEAMLAAGQRVFGENRVQEAQGRWSERRAATAGLELRLVGPLQTNKAEDAAALFDVIETLDREKLARALAKAVEKTGRRPRLYVQVNTGEEPQKAGIAPADAPAFVDLCRDAYGLSIEGLMCIPPVDEPAAPHFALLARLAAELGLNKLSMGMSADYELAARLGATSVRVGSALFGERPAPQA
jgi:pyridoxal phosphate enzyme (YggS family)